ncbi:MAG: helix-turn-helix transcriptional regulator [Caldilineaceae bacterium]
MRRPSPRRPLSDRAHAAASAMSSDRSPPPGSASNREIADKLAITEHTVQYHVGKILERLQFQSRYELASYAPEQGFASGGDDRDP